jgi:rhomboid family GlyGly-CTERM serine protease
MAECMQEAESRVSIPLGPSTRPRAMQRTQPNRWWQDRTWTLGLCAAMAGMNLGLLPHAAAPARALLDWLQFDRAAILHGEIWRLLTGNLVHWSPEHFLLDVGAFLVIGLMYEPAQRRQYPWLLLVAALSVGLGVLILLPEMSMYRGLSGADSGQFVLALTVEFQLARNERRRWLWLAPTLGVFTLKILSETVTGQMFFGTESLGNIGLPTPLAHAAGATAVLALWISHQAFRRGGDVTEQGYY